MSLYGQFESLISSRNCTIASYKVPNICMQSTFLVCVYACHSARNAPKFTHRLKYGLNFYIVSHYQAKQYDVYILYLIHCSIYLFTQEF